MQCPKRHGIHWSSLRATSSARVTRSPFLRLSLILAIPILLGSFLQACGGGGGGAPVTNIKSITIDPVNSSIAVGTKVQLHATANFKNKTTKDVTDSVTWESADETVVTVSNAAAIKGLAGGKAAGATTVRAKLHGITGVSAFTVTKASLKSITVEPVNPLVSTGTTVQMAALGNFSDGSVQDLTTQTSWDPGNSSIAQVSNRAGTIGLVTGLSGGNTPITATFSGIAGSTMVTVIAATLTSITITPPYSSIADGTTEQLAATCNFSDGITEDCTDEVRWSSSNSGIAQVSAIASTIERVTGVAVGNSTITGSFGGIQGSATVTVTAATLISITITPDLSIAKGTTVELTATGNFSDGTTEDLTDQVSWTSSDEAIAQVSNLPSTQGLVTGLGVGNASITATLNGIEDSDPVTVTAATLGSLTLTLPNPSIAKGTAEQLTATGTFGDGTTQDLTDQVSWTSSNEAIAQVSNVPDTPGFVTGLGVGNTTITATLNGVAGSTTVTVTAATLTSIEITPRDPSIAKGTAEQLTATGTFSDRTTQDLTDQVSWTSGNEAIAEVDNVPDTPGLVMGLGVGSTSITATLNGVSGSTTVTVTGATLTSIEITPPNPSMAQGLTFLRLTATGTFSDGTTKDITGRASWTSSTGNIALVFNGNVNGGLVMGVGVGSATISASLNGMKGATTVTVTSATLVAIVIEPPNRSIAKGTSLQLAAIGIFSDLTTQNLTQSVSWTSGNDAVAQVSNISGTQGLIAGQGVGSTAIAATLNGVSGSSAVTVTAAILTSIEITPPNSLIAKGTTEQLTATGAFSDGTTEDLTDQVSWTSADNTIAEVSDAPDSKGLVTGINLGGPTTMLATLNGIQGSAMVTVTAAILETITVGPPNPSIAKGTTVQLTATGNFSDGSTEDFTDQVSWISADNTIAQVGNASGTEGLVTGQGIGTASITASLNGMSGSTTVTVTAATLSSIAIMPANPSIAKGTTVQLTAIATFSDGSTEDLTDQVSWTSGNHAIAEVSNVLDTRGLVTGTGMGSAAITATLNGVSGSTTVTVTAATLTSITVTPANSSIAKGTTALLTATCAFSDGSTPNCTSLVSWTSGANTIAQVSNALGTSGLVTGIAVGNTTITATLGGISGSTTVTVTVATLVSIIVTPANPTVPAKGALKMVATAVFSDGTMQDVTGQASWTSSNNGVVFIVSSGSPITNGRLTGRKLGTATITATIPTLGNAQGSTVVTVT